MVAVFGMPGHIELVIIGLVGLLVFGVPIVMSYLLSAAILIGVLLWRGERV